MYVTISASTITHIPAKLRVALNGGDGSVDAARAIEAILRHDLQATENLSLYDQKVYSIIARYAPCSYSEIAQLARLHRTTVADSVDRLKREGWLATRPVTPYNRTARTIFIVGAPRPTQKAIAQLIEDYRWRAPRAGEFLALTWLTLLAVSVRYQDCARPKVLANPLTGQPMEVDRLFVDEGVGVEFNGRQHYEDTAFSNESGDYLQQQTRDHVKRSLCADQGIKLIVLTPNALSYEGILAKIQPHLRVRQIDTSGEVVRQLTRMCREYQSSCVRAARREKRLTSLSAT